jgi:hypothetical protein
MRVNRSRTIPTLDTITVEVADEHVELSQRSSSDGSVAYVSIHRTQLALILKWLREAKAELLADELQADRQAQLQAAELQADR